MNGTFIIEPVAGAVSGGIVRAGVPPIHREVTPTFAVGGVGPGPTDVQFVPDPAPASSQWALWIWALRPLNGFGAPNPPRPVGVAFAPTIGDLPTSGFQLGFVMRRVWLATTEGEVSYILSPSRRWARFYQNPAGAVAADESAFAYYIERIL